MININSKKINYLTGLTFDDDGDKMYIVGTVLKIL